MAAQREAVHVRAGHLELLGDLGGLRGHLLARERVGEPVVGHGVERLDVAHAEPEARLGEQVGRPRHRLHAARHREVEIARAHGLIDDADGPQARGADLVDGLRGDLLGDPGLDLGLAGRDLPLAGLQHLAHDHVLDLVRLDLGALERGLDRGRAELGGVHARQTSAELAERCAGCAEYDGSAHRRSSSFFGSRSVLYPSSGPSNRVLAVSGITRYSASSTENKKPGGNPMATQTKNAGKIY